VNARRLRSRNDREGGGRRVRVPRGLLAGGHGSDCAPTPGRIGSGRTQVLDGVSHTPAGLGLIAAGVGLCVRLFLSFRTPSSGACERHATRRIRLSPTRDMPDAILIDAPHKRPRAAGHRPGPPLPRRLTASRCSCGATSGSTASGMSDLPDVRRDAAQSSVKARRRRRAQPWQSDIRTATYCEPQRF
jgi:hypothetical protein